MKYGFTGSQDGFPEQTILQELHKLNLKEGDFVITGGCVGVDSQIAEIVHNHFPFVKQIVIAPYVEHLPSYNQKKLNKKVFSYGRVYVLPYKEEYTKNPFLCYRDRNIKIVECSDKVIGFKKGNKLRSGTQMTINLAQKANKLHRVVYL